MSSDIEEKIKEGLKRSEEINNKLRKIDEETDKALKVTDKDMRKEVN